MDRSLSFSGEWDAAIEDMQAAMTETIKHADYLGGTLSLWSLIFKHSGKDSLETCVKSLVTIHQGAAETLQSRKLDQVQKILLIRWRIWQAALVNHLAL